MKRHKVHAILQANNGVIYIIHYLHQQLLFYQACVLHNVHLLLAHKQFQYIIQNPVIFKTNVACNKLMK